MSQKERTYQVAIVEDHLLQRKRIEELMRSQDEFEVVFSGETAPAFMSWLNDASIDESPDVLILDLMVERQPSVDVDLVKTLLAAGYRIVVLSALASPPLVRSIVRAGVSTILGKRDTEADIVDAIRATVRGEQWVTAELAAVIAGDPDRPKLSIQEERALVLYATGLSLDEVASEMNLQRYTARQYINRVKSKYEAAGIPARTRLDLGRIAWNDGYVDPILKPLEPQ
ncbi:response regulator transcription factor [Ruania alkalisoli]|uniref:Response regulator transcription factor n=1 Tax=Ruania alkalisoli TaxID=2779775 RepID=A0A7M1SU28_9MICO|nr:response regulator [Ruania alkalisoli]QOR71078.1 response regulator transcription factor [Ruania alkalisoli]